MKPLCAPYSAFYQYQRENHLDPLDVQEIMLDVLASHGLAGVMFDELKRQTEQDQIAQGISQGVAA